MRTDSLLYQLFLEAPSLFFALLGEDPARGARYEFRSVELKEAAYRIDGVFVPERNDEELYVVEIQFQRDEKFYSRLFAEIFLYLR